MLTITGKHSLYVRICLTFYVFEIVLTAKRTFFKLANLDISVNLLLGYALTLIYGGYK